MTSDDLIWIREAPKGLQKYPRKTQYVRRSHRKSRGGCRSCKSRRVKCDEQKPTCGQCLHRSTDCNYLLRDTNDETAHTIHRSRTPAQHDESPYPSTSELSAEACMGVHVFATSISRVVNQRMTAGLSNNSLAYILQHFERTGYSTISSPLGQRILHDKVPRMIMSQPFLLHSVLAFSSSHLEYLSRNNFQRGNLGVTAGYHTQRALGLYADRIRLHQKDVNHDLMRNSSGLEEMDSLFAACIMLTSLFYHTDEVDLPHTSWTVSSPNTAYQDGRCEPGIDWLTNTSGLSILMQLEQFHQRLRDSIWLPFIVETTRMNSVRSRLPSKMNVNFTPPSNGTRFSSTSSSTTSGGFSPQNSLPQGAHDFQAPPFRLPELGPATLPDIPPHLLALVLISPNLSIYGPALFPLQTVLSLDPANLSNFGAFISFPSLLSPEFIALVRQRNPHSNLSSEDEVFRCTNGRGKPTKFTASIPGYTSIDIDAPTPVWPEMLAPLPPDPDPIALLIFGYWFQRIGAIPHWWCGRRGRGECVAILQWLKGRLAQAGGGCAASNGKEGRRMFVRVVHEFKQHVAKVSAGWGDDIGRVLLEVVLEGMAEPCL